MKKICWLGLVILLVGGSLAWAEEKIIDPKTLDGKTLEEIYLMRNEIYARHGKPFRTHELHTYFKSQDWYKLDVKYSDSRLSKTNWKNIAILKAKEEELLKQNYLTKDGQTKINLNNVVNQRQFGKFSPQDMEKLSTHGFLVVDPRTPESLAKDKQKKPPQEDYSDRGADYEQFFYLYDQNDYRGIANFVTTDSLLQLYHIFFDYTLRNLEKEKLFPLVKTLNAEMLKHSQALYKQAPNPAIKEAARRNIAYFAVAQYFLTGNLPPLEPSVAVIVKAEIDKCQRHEKRDFSLIFNTQKELKFKSSPDNNQLITINPIDPCQLPAGKDTAVVSIPPIDPESIHLLDYSQFVPRGHYDRSPELQRYFMGMMWFGLNAFTAEEDTDLLQSLIIAQQLYGKLLGSNKLLIMLWEQIYEPTVFYVGAANDLTPQDYKQIINQVFGSDPAYKTDLNYGYFTDKNRLKEVRKLSAERFGKKKRIKVQLWGVPQGPQFRFMGQRFIPDSYILQRLSTFPQKPGDPTRGFPKGLDVTAALGSKEAKRLLLEDYKEGNNWKEYPQKLEELIREFQELKSNEWQQNLYYQWLWTLKSLIELSQEFKYPFFMHNQAWERKSLTTAQASWAELRHDTILYGQASGAEAGDGGDDWVPDPPQSYVEPNVVFYQRLRDLLILSQQGLKKRDLLTHNMEKRFNNFIEMASFLEQAAAKELKGQFLSKEEYKRIKYFGGWLESLTLSVMTDEDLRWFEIQSDTDKNIAVIADIHTCLNQALEVGVGPAFEIYVVAEIGGQLKLTRGAVFSYYEFIHPASDRLTDAKWQQMLKEGKEAPLPPWTELYLSNKRGHKLP